MNDVLVRWNGLHAEAATREVLPCCGSRSWAHVLMSARPFADEAALFTASDEVWRGLPEAAWREAFDSHPRIGQRHADGAATAESLRWSAREQQAAATQDAADALAEGNRRYEERFGRIFIVCASGRSAEEILAILERRMCNDDATEFAEAGEQQRMITQLRLRKWMGVE